MSYNVYPIAETGQTRPLSAEETRNLGYVKQILLVDDSALIRRTVRTVLERELAWIACEEAENGREAVEKALQLQPALVVLDLVMPVMNGIETSRALKRLMPKLPLVMFTTFDDPSLHKEAKDAGVHAIVDKKGRRRAAYSQHQKPADRTISAPVSGWRRGAPFLASFARNGSCQKAAAVTGPSSQTPV